LHWYSKALAKFFSVKRDNLFLNSYLCENHGDST